MPAKIEKKMPVTGQKKLATEKKYYLVTFRKGNSCEI